MANRAQVLERLDDPRQRVGKRSGRRGQRRALIAVLAVAVVAAVAGVLLWQERSTRLPSPSPTWRAEPTPTRAQPGPARPQPTVLSPDSTSPARN